MGESELAQPGPHDLRIGLRLQVDQLVAERQRRERIAVVDLGEAVDTTVLHRGRPDPGVAMVDLIRILKRPGGSDVIVNEIFPRLRPQYDTIWKARTGR